MRRVVFLFSAVAVVVLGTVVSSSQGPGVPAGVGPGHVREGRRLFEQETFGGNGRTCRTCHGSQTGTVSPQDAQKRFEQDPDDPLFLLDGSDDGNGNGVTRMLTDATILMNIPLAPNVILADDPAARFVTVRRGIPTTLNTPALDPVLMLDGRQPSLQAQADGAINDHAQATVFPTAADLDAIREFQLTNGFFSTPALRRFAQGGPAPASPEGHTASERRGRRFFENVPPDPTDFRPGLCSHCHSGPLMNQTNEFAPLFSGLPIPTGTRFLNVLVSELNVIGNDVREFVFDPGPTEVHVLSPDAGRALITGIVDDPLLGNVNAFKIPQLRGIRHTAPYFHDNSAKTLEDVAAHYALFFNIVTGGFINLTQQDQQDLVAFMKILD